MTTSTVTMQAAPTHVETTVNYFPAEGGTTSYVAGSAAFWNRKFIPTKVPVENIRGKEADYSLDKQGFQLVRHSSEQGDLKDEERIKDSYYAETEQLLQRV